MKPKKIRSVAVIGGGAAGFFTAVNAALINPDLKITIFEKSREVLSKVRISGGGRCNVTHNCFDPERLSKHYPRGEKTLRWSFEQFQAKDTVDWFEDRGVKLKAEDDGRMFPISDNSQSIIDCLLNEAKKGGVRIRTKTKVEAVNPKAEGGFELSISKSSPEHFDAVVVATGGYNREKAYGWLKKLGHSINSPVPSLFTFNFREKVLTDLAGISVENAHVQIEQLPFEEAGPVLITHWGLSGPAVLKISAWAARDLHDLEYRFDVLVNWVYPDKEHAVREKLIKLRESNARKTVSKQDHFPFPNRLWDRFLELSGIKTDKRWADLSNKEIHDLTQTLFRSRYNIQGKTTYKEEFVTCGGVPLNEVNPDTLESKKIPGLFFVGEVLDIDGVTGGFNFQAAWTNGWLAANALGES
ncbi:NAD(P)/FAD-dependent oxidoreductase [Rhodohalobacter barkolensis]|uniref:Aminoacetone oxidase family FAD-binding enzyme n=1 Tax=Rhodohalobacter barkolensis TaxID=2053187 RepID=A0A2N0VI54_9BACT|nr:NAD(P)/FAD-dependent oxidoreductase [Rhodohalobacter barkolensis]PKD43844.1 aminoacetone oxidase family FAD-binding enzyme [Rhodohalobacter barkolensis]